MKELTLVIPAKNASRHISETFRSIAAQTFKERLKILVLCGKSNDGTEEVLREHQDEYGVETIIVSQGPRYMEELAELFGSIETKYFGLTNWSDYYLDTGYLEEAVGILEQKNECSYVHADVLSRAVPSKDFPNGCLYNPLPRRSVIRPCSGSGMYANYAAFDDFINELTLVGRSSQMAEILKTHMKSRLLKDNTFAAILYSYFALGLVGEYVHRVAAVGVQHYDARSNQQEFNAANLYIDAVNSQRRILLRKGVQTFRWRDAALNVFPEKVQTRLRKEYEYQMAYIQRVLSHDGVAWTQR